MADAGVVPIHPPGEKTDWAALHVLPADASVENVRSRVDKDFGDGLDIRNYDTKVKWTEKKDYHMTLIATTKPEDYGRITDRIKQAGIRWSDMSWDGEPYFVISHRPGSTNTVESGKGFWVQGIRSRDADMLRDNLLREFPINGYVVVPFHVTIAVVEYKIKPKPSLDSKANFVYRPSVASS